MQSLVPAFIRKLKSDDHLAPLVREWGLSSTNLEEVFFRLVAQERAVDALADDLADAAELDRRTEEAARLSAELERLATVNSTLKKRTKASPRSSPARSQAGDSPQEEPLRAPRAEKKIPPQPTPAPGSVSAAPAPAPTPTSTTATTTAHVSTANRGVARTTQAAAVFQRAGLVQLKRKGINRGTGCCIAFACLIGFTWAYFVGNWWHLSAFKTCTAAFGEPKFSLISVGLASRKPGLDDDEEDVEFWRPPLQNCTRSEIATYFAKENTAPVVVSPWNRTLRDVAVAAHVNDSSWWHHPERLSDHLQSRLFYAPPEATSFDLGTVTKTKYGVGTVHFEADKDGQAALPSAAKTLDDGAGPLNASATYAYECDVFEDIKVKSQVAGTGILRPHWNRRPSLWYGGGTATDFGAIAVDEDGDGGGILVSDRTGFSSGDLQAQVRGSQAAIRDLRRRYARPPFQQKECVGRRSAWMLAVARPDLSCRRRLLSPPSPPSLANASNPATTDGRPPRSGTIRWPSSTTGRRPWTRCTASSPT